MHQGHFRLRPPLATPQALLLSLLDSAVSPPTLPGELVRGWGCGEARCGRIQYHWGATCVLSCPVMCSHPPLLLPAHSTLLTQLCPLNPAHSTLQKRRTEALDVHRLLESAGLKDGSGCVCG